MVTDQSLQLAILMIGVLWKASSLILDLAEHRYADLGVDVLYVFVCVVFLLPSWFQWTEALSPARPGSHLLPGGILNLSGVAIALICFLEWKRRRQTNPTPRLDSQRGQPRR